MPSSLQRSETDVSRGHGGLRQPHLRFGVGELAPAFAAPGPCHLEPGRIADGSLVRVLREFGMPLGLAYLTSCCTLSYSFAQDE